MNDKDTEKKKIIYNPYNNNIEVQSPTKKDLTEYLNKPNIQLEENSLSL